MVMRDGQDVAVMRGPGWQAEGEERDAREWPELCKGLLMWAGVDAQKWNARALWSKNWIGVGGPVE